MLPEQLLLAKSSVASVTRFALAMLARFHEDSRPLALPRAVRADPNERRPVDLD